MRHVGDSVSMETVCEEMLGLKNLGNSNIFEYT